MHFETFDSVEDMFDAIEANERAAEAAVREWQKRIKVGDYVMRHDSDEDIWIYTEILDPIAGEEKLCDPNNPEDQEHMALLRDAWSPGGPKRCRRWGKHYSIFSPNGELGELHISTVTAIIPKLVFDVATNENSSPECRDGKTLAHVFRQLIIQSSHGFVGEDWAKEVT